MLTACAPGQGRGLQGRALHLPGDQAQDAKRGACRQYPVGATAARLGGKRLADENVAELESRHRARCDRNIFLTVSAAKSHRMYAKKVADVRHCRCPSRTRCLPLSAESYIHVPAHAGKISGGG